MDEKKTKMVASLMLSSLAFASIVGLLLFTFSIPVTTIIPSIAPVWMGTLTLSYMVQS